MKHIFMAIAILLPVSALAEVPCDYNTTGCVLKQYATVDNGPVKIIGRK